MSAAHGMQRFLGLGCKELMVKRIAIDLVFYIGCAEIRETVGNKVIPHANIDFV